MTEPVAILPARGGSKRIPRKNIRDFAGKPALAWPLTAASAAHIFSRIVVSTDDAEIAEIARTNGAEVPFTRDAALADDHAGTTEVIRDAVRRLRLPPDTPVCCIYPTALFLQSRDLQRGLEQLKSGATWVLTAGLYPTPIDRAYRLDGDSLVPRSAVHMPMRSQDLEPAYMDLGQFYWARAATWTDETAKVWDGAKPVLLPPDRAVDIDTEDDWARAELLFKLMQSGRAG